MGKRWITRGSIAALLIVSALLIPATALAHKPIFANGSGSSWAAATRIADPEVSWAVYAALDEPSQVDYYQFEANPGNQLFAQILIPQMSGLHNFRPTLALVGPGLPAPGVSLPVDLPVQTGAVVVEASTDNASAEFFEPFSQTSYWQRQEIVLTAPAQGAYYLLVFDRQGDVGRYVLAVGSREEFGAADWLQFPVTWWRVQWWFGRGAYVVVGAVVVVLMFAFVALVALGRVRFTVSPR